MKKVGLLPLLLLLTLIPAQAAEKSWYLNPELRYFRASYPNPLQAAVDGNKAESGVSVLSAEAQLSVYFPISKNWLLGPSMSAAMDRFGATNAWSLIYQFSFGASGLYFLQEPGRGFFTRTELGTCFANARNSYGLSTSSNLGLALLSGAGFALPLSGALSATLGANFAIKFIEGARYPAVTIGAGLIF